MNIEDGDLIMSKEEGDDVVMNKEEDGDDIMNKEEEDGDLLMFWLELLSMQLLMEKNTRDCWDIESGGPSTSKLEHCTSKRDTTLLPKTLRQ